MLKCLKLEFTQCKREYMTLMIVILIGFFASGFITSMSDVFAMYYGQLATFLGIIFLSLTTAFMVICAVVFVRLFTTYYKNMFTITGYMYGTLPVKTNQLLGAKFLFSFIWWILFAIICFLGVILYFLGFVIAETINTNGQLMVDLMKIMSSYSFNTIVTSIFNELFNINMLKGLGSALLLMSLLLSCVILVNFLLITLFNSTYMNYLHKWMRYAGYVVIIILMFFGLDIIFRINSVALLDVILAIISVVCFVATSFLLEHKVDVNC